MKRMTVTALTCLLLITAALSGCIQADTPGTGDSANKISIVCTTFPQYDWTLQILGDTADNAEVTLLMGNGIDPHSYQPTIADIAKISACDLFIFTGGESDKWITGALAEAANPDMVAINLLDILGEAAKTEEITAEMEAEDEGEELEYDEHVWLSLQNAKAFCAAIADALFSLNPDSAGIYESNVAAYNEKLAALDEAYRTAINGAEGNTLLFGDRFPFRYLTEDYGLSYCAAFPGCSAETEASFDTIAALAEQADKLGLNVIFVTETADQSIAKTIRDNTAEKNQQILVLNSIQSVTWKDIDSGTTYLSIMEDNLNTLKEALK